MPKITPFLWFDNQAEEAVNFYKSVFKNAKVTDVSRCGDAGPGPKGSVMTATFQLEDQEFIALNGGPQFKFTEAISFAVSCDTQEEINDLWNKLTEDGEPGQCGWLKDKFGVSWQIIPKILGELLNQPDPVAAEKIMRAMLSMKKIDIEALRQAALTR